jgi:hypothetical protein
MIKNLNGMLKINHSLASWILGVPATLLLTACGETKVVQCNKFIQVTEKVRVSLAPYAETTQTLNKKVPKDLNGFIVLAKERSQHLSQWAGRMDQALQLIEGLNIQDEKLKSFQNEYINITKLTKEFTLEQSKITSAQSQFTEVDVKSGNIQKTGQDFENISLKRSVSSESEQKLMDNFNAYCSGSTKK